MYLIVDRDILSCLLYYSIEISYCMALYGQLLNMFDSGWMSNKESPVNEIDWISFFDIPIQCNLEY